MEGWPKLTKITIYNKYFAKIIQLLGPALLLDFIVFFFSEFDSGFANRQIK